MNTLSEFIDRLGQLADLESVTSEKEMICKSPQSRNDTMMAGQDTRAVCRRMARVSRDEVDQQLVRG